MEEKGEDEWADSEASASDKEDDEFHSQKPIYAFWAEKGLTKTPNMRSARKGRSAGADMLPATDRKRRLQASYTSSLLRFFCLFSHLSETLSVESDNAKSLQLERSRA